MLRAMTVRSRWCASDTRGRSVFAGVARKLAGSASGLCLISAPDDSLETRIPVGRVWQRAWLEACEQGLACQPMMSLCVLRNVRDNAPELMGRIGQHKALSLLREFEDLFRCIAGSCPGAIMRMGYATNCPQRESGDGLQNRAAEFGWEAERSARGFKKDACEDAIEKLDLVDALGRAVDLLSSKLVQENEITGQGFGEPALGCDRRRYGNGGRNARLPACDGGV